MKWDSCRSLTLQHGMSGNKRTANCFSSDKSETVMYANRTAYSWITEVILRWRIFLSEHDRRHDACAALTYGVTLARRYQPLMSPLRTARLQLSHLRLCHAHARGQFETRPMTLWQRKWGNNRSQPVTLRRSHREYCRPPSNPCSVMQTRKTTHSLDGQHQNDKSQNDRGQR